MPNKTDSEPIIDTDVLALVVRCNRLESAIRRLVAIAGATSAAAGHTSHRHELDSIVADLRGPEASE